jgi:endonuclease-8
LTPIGDVDGALRLRLVGLASDQLRANLATARRTTVPGGLAVYGRTGRACRRCGTAIRSLVHGHHPRRTYWCPGCQTRPLVEPDQPIAQ